ncbi:MAG: hypothetical protein ABR533_12355, partial [Desulfonatronovibrio sp.]
EFESMNFPATMADDFISVGGSLKSFSGNLFTLDAQLRLGETQSISKTISSPKIITLNNEEASIEQGIQIPFTTRDKDGNPDTKFQDATLKLVVTPQITWDNNLILLIKINDDNPVAAFDVTAIETRRINTRLFVESGEIIAIGGIKKVVEDQTQNQIPNLGNVPILGWLFKNEFRSNRKDELLIFIRPEII